MDYSLPDSVQAIAQARILEWVANSFSRGSSQLRGRTQVCLLHCRWFPALQADSSPSEPPGKPKCQVLISYEKSHPELLHILVCQEQAMAPYSSTLAWKILRREEPGGLQSMGSLRVRYDWATSLSLFASSIGEGNGNPLQRSCLENPWDGGAWWAAVYGVAQSRTRLKRLSSSSRYCFIIKWIDIG